MAYTYQISDELQSIQNVLLKNTIKANTNVELLNTEKSVQSLYASYAKKIQNVGDKLFNFKDHIVETRSLITKDYFDELFQDVYTDLHALYINVKYIDDLLDKQWSRKGRPLAQYYEYRRDIYLPGELARLRLAEDGFPALRRLWIGSYRGLRTGEKEEIRT